MLEKMLHAKRGGVIGRRRDGTCCSSVAAAVVVLVVLVAAAVARIVTGVLPNESMGDEKHCDIKCL